MTNRRAVLLGLLPVFVLVAILAGCKRTDVTAGATEPPSEAAQILAEIRKYSEATGSDLKALTEEIKRQQSLESAKAGDPPVVKDLNVARAALGEALEAAKNKNLESATPALQRLERVVICLSAEMPATAIAQQVDRALYLIKQQEAMASREYMSASLTLLAASEAVVNGRPPALVPDVLRDIEAAKSALDSGHGDQAHQSLNTVLAGIANHPPVVVMTRMRQAVLGAQAALLRQAWPVVEAELAEVKVRLEELTATAAPESVKPKPETPAATTPSAAPTTSTTPAPAVTTPAPTSEPAASTPATTPAAAPATTAAPAPTATTPAPSTATAAPAPSKNPLQRLFPGKR